MKKQIVISFVTLFAFGVAIAAIIPLIKPPGAGSGAARMLALRLSPIGIIGAIIVFFLSKPKNVSNHSTDGHN